ncbi:cobalt-precorrin-6A reductase [Shimia ponticola]|uniref:cobalt-precorrin-6A reductase n=1 Tax=Shimia ponticola TaxID=2582893 RepID=UPI0011BDDB16|nr:cobalt-precorrin-6A reductase [Shimia ponticola]
MTKPTKILLLAGTQEGRALAKELSHHGIDTIASLAGATRDATKLAVPTRVGGFGGAAGFENYLHDHGVRAVLDATHPFANRISRRSFEVCTRIGIPYVQVLRPAWQAMSGDTWYFVDQEEEAAGLIASDATVFLATGRQTLERFQNLSGRRVICRQIDPPTQPFPFEGGEFLVGRPPFTVDDEIALFSKLGVDWLIVKNAGGSASSTKLTAARELGIPVIMINRPKPTGAETVRTVHEAMQWVLNL